MLYEVRTYDLKPRSVPEFEQEFGSKVPGRQKFSQLGGLWQAGWQASSAYRPRALALCPEPRKPIRKAAVKPMPQNDTEQD